MTILSLIIGLSCASNEPFYADEIAKSVNRKYAVSTVRNIFESLPAHEKDEGVDHVLKFLEVYRLRPYTGYHTVPITEIFKALPADRQAEAVPLLLKMIVNSTPENVYQPEWVEILDVLTEAPKKEAAVLILGKLIKMNRTPVTLSFPFDALKIFDNLPNEIKQEQGVSFIRKALNDLGRAYYKASADSPREPFLDPDTKAKLEAAIQPYSTVTDLAKLRG